MLKNILVVKLSAIGDVIHALPVSYAIKETFPAAHLTWVVEPPAFDLLKMNPCVDEIIIFRKKEFKSLRGFVRNFFPFRREIARSFLLVLSKGVVQAGKHIRRNHMEYPLLYQH